MDAGLAADLDDAAEDPADRWWMVAPGRRQLLLLAIDHLTDHRESPLEASLAPRRIQMDLNLAVGELGIEGHKAKEIQLDHQDQLMLVEVASVRLE